MSIELTDEQIREVFLANGFTIKEGQTDLKPYVYAAARALIALDQGGGARDAARYRWLAENIATHRLWTRKGSWFCAPINATEADGYPSMSDAIDAAMSASKEGA